MIDAGIGLFFQGIGSLEGDAQAGRFDHFNIIGPVADGKHVGRHRGRTILDSSVDATHTGRQLYAGDRAMVIAILSNVRLRPDGKPELQVSRLYFGVGDARKSSPSPPQLYRVGGWPATGLCSGVFSGG